MRRVKQTRVLKERRIISVSWTSTLPFLCGVPSEHTNSLGCGSQGDALGWYAMPIQGNPEVGGGGVTSSGSGAIRELE